MPDIIEMNMSAVDAVNGFLLTDSEATRARIQAEFEELAKRSPADTVFIEFSGHRSQTHELVAHDTQIADLASTAIPLNLLVQWFSRIPTQRLRLFLDCCFSGRTGAKVLQIGAKLRSIGTAGATGRPSFSTDPSCEACCQTSPMLSKSTDFPSAIFLGAFGKSFVVA